MSEYTGTGIVGWVVYVLYMYACTYNITGIKNFIPVNCYQCIHVLYVLCCYE